MTYQVNADELRYVAGNSSKFYRTYVIDRGADTIAVIQYGRIGAHGRVEIAGNSGRRLAAAKRQQKRAKGYQPYAGRTFEVDPQWFDAAYQRGDAGVIGVRLSAAFGTATDSTNAEADDEAPPAQERPRKPRTRRTNSLNALLTRGEDLLNEVLASPDPLDQAGAVLQYVADVETARTTLVKADNYVSMLTEKVRSAV